MRAGDRFILQYDPANSSSRGRIHSTDDPVNQMNRQFALTLFAAMFLFAPMIVGCGGGDENRVVTGIATEYQMQRDAQKQYEEAMRKAKR